MLGSGVDKNFGQRSIATRVVVSGHSLESARRAFSVSEAIAQSDIVVQHTKRREIAARR
jgi:hypothetical protein